MNKEFTNSSLSFSIIVNNHQYDNFLNLLDDEFSEIVFSSNLINHKYAKNIDHDVFKKYFIGIYEEFPIIENVDVFYPELSEDVVENEEVVDLYCFGFFYSYEYSDDEAKEIANKIIKPCLEEFAKEYNLECKLFGVEVMKEYTCLEKKMNHL